MLLCFCFEINKRLCFDSGSPLAYQQHSRTSSLLSHQQHYHVPYLGQTHFPFPYPGSPGSPKPVGVHPPLTRVASNPIFPSVPSPTPSSPSPDTPSPTNESIAMSPSTPQQPPNMWPAHTQPLFSLANVISMAMSMAQSFIPPGNIPTQAMPSYPGFHPQLPSPLASQAGYPTLYPNHYQTPAPPVELPYPPVGMYPNPEPAPHMEGAAFYQNIHPQWQYPVSPASVPSTPSTPSTQPQAARANNSPSPSKEDGSTAPHSAQLQPKTGSDWSKSSDLSPSPLVSPKDKVS